MITLQTQEKFVRMIVSYNWSDTTGYVCFTYQKVKLPVFNHISCVS